ncbi:MAG TPA: ATP-binding protein, partial [Longimicrobium sp.]|nr:ATP-binding protein [Longimicrobium sp.]
MNGGSPVGAGPARAGPLRIALVGPESSGKTTLARLLAEHYGAAWVEEYVREYMEQRDVGRGYARPFALDDLEHIGRGQIEAEDRAAAGAASLLFCDTELLTTEIWG